MARMTNKGDQELRDYQAARMKSLKATGSFDAKGYLSGTNPDFFGHDSELELYEKLLNKAANRVGTSTESIEELMDIIAFHETAQSMDPGLIHDNAGRGLFGYEIGPLSDEDGVYNNPSGSARTAMNRLYAQAGGSLTTNIQGKKPIDMPKFMIDYFSGTNASGDVVASDLTEQQQKILFLADHLEAGDFDNFTDSNNNRQIGKTLIANDEYSRWWGQYHKRGGTPDYDIFEGNMTDYKRNKKNN
jgi:hypothetical protein|tara:strand:+ start:3348 stop:4082 length:735 start_codon:yes stop_codon:yes gene_type:complete